MAKSLLPSPPHGWARGYLETLTADRKRSNRPLEHETPCFTIAQLHYWKMMRVGDTTRWEPYGNYSIRTKLFGERPRFEIRQGKTLVAYDLVSKPFGTGLSWFFRDPVTGGLVKSIYVTPEGLGGRYAVGALYASQFQDKVFRKLLRMDKLRLSIEGASLQGFGRARGKSRLRKLADLRRLLKEVKSADQQREKVLAEFPQFIRTISFSKSLLRRELPKLPKGWDTIDGVKKARKANAAGQGS